jgi:hypothetical protein
VRFSRSNIGNPASRLQRIGRVARVAAGLIVLAACSTTTITPEKTEKPAEAYATVAVGEFAPTDKLWEANMARFRAALVGRLRAAQAFEIADPAPAELLPSAFRLSGRITEVEKGDRALRLIIGFGAGRARVAGQFEIADRSGVVARFETRKAYSGGAGIGGMDFIDIDDLMQKLGEATAEAVIRWSKGGSLTETAAR